MTRKKKSLIFFIICCFCLTVTILTAFPANAQNSGPVAITGNIPLVIYNISVTGIDTSDATLSWQTNGAANSTIEYGTTSSYGSASSDALMVTNHSITLSGLSSNTIYHFQLVSANLAGDMYSSTDSTFQTLALPTPTPTTNGGGSNGGRSNGYASYGGVVEAPAPFPNLGPLLAPPMGPLNTPTQVPQEQPGVSGIQVQPAFGASTGVRSIAGWSIYILLLIVLAGLLIGGSLVYFDWDKKKRV